MAKGTGISRSYRSYQDGDWKLWIAPEHWNPDWWRVVRDRINEQKPSKHPQTMKLEFSDRQGENVFFLKVFHRHSIWNTVKDIFRDSKAVRALRQGFAITQTEFQTPFTLAAGERRRHTILERSFLLTRGVNGLPLPSYLYDRWQSGSAGMSFGEKRRAVEKLAADLSLFHTLGFVHGDLVPANIFVAAMPDGGIGFYLMDNDRTRRYPHWVPQMLWRRNLVQLNRFPLPAISLHDRMRFLKRYLARERWKPGDRRLISWLEKKTRQRRWECDQVQGARSFRELMRWNGPFAGRARVSISSASSAKL